MEHKVNFRAYQEHVAGDHNDLQEFVQNSLDHLTHDAVTESARYSGFTITKTGQTEVTVTPGRMYTTIGAIHVRESTLVQSMITHLAATTRRYVTLSVLASTVQENNETRDFIINVDTREAEAQPVDMTETRAASLVLTPGSESSDPQKVAPPSGHVVVAYAADEQH